MRRACPSDTWAGLTAPVTYLHEDGRVEHYEIPVTVWIVDGPQMLAERQRERETQAPRAPQVILTPTIVDGVPTIVLGARRVQRARRRY